MVMLNFDVIFLIVAFMKYRNSIAPVSKRWVVHNLKQRNMRLSLWKTKRLVFTYLKMFGTVQNTWLTWQNFAHKQLQLTRRSRNIAGNLSWKEAVVRTMTWNKCQGCGKQSNSNVFGTCICAICRNSQKKINCYMISTGKAVLKGKAYGVPASIIIAMPFYRTGYSKNRFNIDVNSAIARFVASLEQ